MNAETKPNPDYITHPGQLIHQLTEAEAAHLNSVSVGFRAVPGQECLCFESDGALYLVGSGVGLSPDV